MARKPYTPVYAIIRIDFYETKDRVEGAPTLAPLDERFRSSPAILDDRNLRVTVKEVVYSMEEADREVARLNTLNSDKGCVYFVEYTRLITNS